MNHTTETDIRPVCKECLEKTKIGYADKGGFFTPHLKSINHLEVGYSKIISNPLTILAEKILARFYKLKDGINNLWKRLFPRRDRLYGKQMDSALVGRIIFSRKENGEEVPIHHMHLDFWSRTKLGQWRKLSEGLTEPDGTFRLPFDLSYARRFAVRELRFEICQMTHVFYAEDQGRPVHNIFKKIKIPKGDLIGMEYNLRTIPLLFWEYRSDIPVPRVIVRNHDKDAPQYYSEGRIEAINEQVIPIELTKVKHLKQIELDPASITLAEIQADYPENLTVCIEKKLPGYTRSDDWFGERMMNGMNRGLFLPDSTEQGAYWMKYFGKLNYESNDEYAFPDAMIKFRLKPDGLPVPVYIKLRGALNAFNKDPWQEREFTPADGEFWSYAKRIARVNGGLCTEVDEHFAGTHANTEQYAIAAHRNLRLNPLAILLFPHLKEVVLINHAADSILLRDYIPHATAFTYNGLMARVRDMVGVMDWKTWHTMEPISPAHTYARAEQLFWDVTAQYVDHFFERNMDGIRKHWHEVYRFSEDLVNHSAPVFLSNIDMEKLSPKERERYAEMKEYLSAQFCFDYDLPRQRRNGELKAVSPITLSIDLNPDREDEEIKNLKKACTYMIFVATFLHTWANEHQYEDIGEVLYNCLGLRFGDKASGILAPESDLGIAPDLTRSTQMMWFSNLLSRTEYGFITRNEEKDINPYFSDLLLSKKEEFAALGVKVEDIESRTNI
jgi:hypothetical protein